MVRHILKLPDRNFYDVLADLDASIPTFEAEIAKLEADLRILIILFPIF